MRSGPEWRGSGRWKGPTFHVPAASSSRRSVRYAAKNRARAILANSPGWKLIGPMLTHRRAPSGAAKPTPGTKGSMRSTIPDEREGPLVPGQVGHAADDDQGGDVGRDRHEGPRRLQAGQVGVDAGDHHVAEPVEQGGEGEQRAVGAAGRRRGWPGGRPRAGPRMTTRNGARLAGSVDVRPRAASAYAPAVMMAARTISPSSVERRICAITARRRR